MSNNDEETIADRETSENTEVEHLADESAIERKKMGRLAYSWSSNRITSVIQLKLSYEKKKRLTYKVDNIFLMS